MSPIADEIIGAYNAQVKLIKESKLENTISLVVFGENHGDVAIKYIAKPANEVDYLTKENYIPSGMTPMRDGVGTLISQLESNVTLAPEDAVALWVFSDGYENASKEWSASALKEKIEKLEAGPQWTFSYVGANQDALKVAKDTGMNTSNALNFNATKFGTIDLCDTISVSMTQYQTMRGTGGTKAINLYDGKTHASKEDTDATQENKPRGLVNPTK